MNTSTTEKSKTTLIALAVAMLLSSGLAGCNTTAGFGQDVEAAGDAIEDKAQKEKGY